MISGPVARPFDTFFRDIFEISDNVTPNEDEIIMMRRMINKFAICLSYNFCKKFNFDKRKKTKLEDDVKSYSLPLVRK